eukprot:COSAG02_NODE_122_length_35306_cov_98.280967_4_plen_103_part_00
MSPYAKKGLPIEVVSSENSVVELLFEELVGWSSWFRAVAHERWVRPLVWATLPSCAEPMCEAERAHHPAPRLEGSDRSDDLQFVFHFIKELCFRHNDQASGR